MNGCTSPLPPILPSGAQSFWWPYLVKLGPAVQRYGQRLQCCFSLAVFEATWVYPRHSGATLNGSQGLSGLKPIKLVCKAWFKGSNICLALTCALTLVYYLPTPLGLFLCISPANFSARTSKFMLNSSGERRHSYSHVPDL